MANPLIPYQSDRASGITTLNLCDPERDVNGYRFTCFDKADGVDTWTCTGSEHFEGFVICCTCECHHRVTVQFKSFTLEAK